MRLPVVSFVAVTVLAAGCAARPTARFDAVPAPSAAAAALPEPAATLALAAGPESAPKLIKATTTAKPKPRARNAAEPSLIITPHPVLTGRVASYSAAGRFVVLNFPVGHLPAMEQRLNIYHQGVKVGEARITGPQRDDHIVADVTMGEAQAGDEVRER